MLLRYKSLNLDLRDTLGSTHSFVEYKYESYVSCKFCQPQNWPLNFSVWSTERAYTSQLSAEDTIDFTVVLENDLSIYRNFSRFISC